MIPWEPLTRDQIEFVDDSILAYLKERGAMTTNEMCVLFCIFRPQEDGRKEQIYKRLKALRELGFVRSKDGKWYLAE